MAPETTPELPKRGPQTTNMGPTSVLEGQDGAKIAQTGSGTEFGTKKAGLCNENVVVLGGQNGFKIGVNKKKEKKTLQNPVWLSASIFLMLIAK